MSFSSNNNNNSMSAAEMQKQYRLPMLPGNTCGEELLRRNFRRAQILTAKEGSPTAGRGVSPRATRVPQNDFDSTSVSKTASIGGPVAGRRSLTQSQQNNNFNSSVSAASNTLQHTEAGRVLRFNAYYTEGVTESANENWRVRKVTILHYLDDNTISVSEKKEDNSGILPQGILLKRHQVQDAKTGGLVGPDSLLVGDTCKFYGREYNIVDCDAFTRQWYAEQGAPQPEACEYPVDQFEAKKRIKGLPKPYVESVVSRTTANGMKVLLSQGEVRATQQFLAHDREVLRCDCVWDDSNHLYGEKRKFILYYFLSDDTIEVIEDYGANSGRDPFPVFCKRQKVAKPNPRGGRQQHSRFLLGENNAATEFYTDADIKIGTKINIFGREFLICGYNEYTKQHVEKFHGVAEHEAIKIAINVPKPKVQHQPPPYNGFGDEVDSLASWRSLDLKPPRIDNTGRRQFKDDVIKFRLKLAKPSACDANRRFVLTYFLADGQLSIFEPPQRNSGIVGGKFLQKCKTKKSDGSAFTPKDFFLGGQVSVNGFTFDIIESDDRTLGIMEKYEKVFPKSRASLAATRLASMIKSAQNDLADYLLATDDAPTRQGLLAMAKEANVPLTEQEVATIFRFFEKHFEDGFSYSEMVGLLVDGQTSAIRGDNRRWEDIEAETLDAEAEHVQASSDADDAAAARQNRDLSQRAHIAAQQFNEYYNQRRRLFEQEFRQITDYAKDSKIGAAEFTKVIQEKLRLGPDVVDCEALCAKLFPPEQKRTSIEEFMRLLHDTSTFSHSLKQLAKK